MTTTYGGEINRLVGVVGSLDHHDSLENIVADRYRDLKLEETLRQTAILNDEEEKSDHQQFCLPKIGNESVDLRDEVLLSKETVRV